MGGGTRRTQLSAPRAFAYKNLFRFEPKTDIIISNLMNITKKQNTTKLSLPFNREWFVFWGGDTKRQNIHHDTPNQKFAFDFVVVDSSGRSHRGNGRKNEDYFCYGKEIFAPTDGKVIEVIDGVRENKPRSMNPYSAVGNAVVIEHSNQEISIFAHLKLGSIRVKVGEKVKTGHPIGLCGNSGNSSEPHLHYHLQDNPIIQDGKGIKCFFQKAIVSKNGKQSLKEKHSPIKGEIISSANNLI